MSKKERDPWTLILILSSCLTLIYGGGALKALWQYQKFSAEIPIKTIQFEPTPKKSEWALRGTYTYRFANKEFTGTALLPKPYYLNLKSAEQQSKSLSQMAWTAWINPHHPASSVLDHPYPLKKIVYALCLLGISLYFVYIKFHVELLSSKL